MDFFAKQFLWPLLSTFVKWWLFFFEGYKLRVFHCAECNGLDFCEPSFGSIHWALAILNGCAMLTIEWNNWTTQICKCISHELHLLVSTASTNTRSKGYVHCVLLWLLSVCQNLMNSRVFTSTNGDSSISLLSFSIAMVF